MAEVGSAQFKANANFRSIIASAKKVAQALRDVEDARRDASGDVEIGIDAKGLRAEARREVEKATSGLEAEIEVDADTTPFQRGLRGALAGARRSQVDVAVQADADEFHRSMRAIVVEGRSGKWKVHVPVELEGDDAVWEARRIVEEAEAGAGTVDVAMDPDGSGFVGEVRRAVREAEATSGSVDVPIEADGSGLRREVSIWTKIAAVGQKIRVPIEVDTKSSEKSLKGIGAAINPGKLLRALKPLLMFPAIVTGVQLLIGALGALGAAVVGVASMVGPLIGLLGTLPGLALAIGGAFASVKLAFSGVGDALKAYDTQQKAAGKTGAQVAKQELQNSKARAAAARGVEDAQRRLADASRRAGEMREDAARRVEAAEEALADTVDQAARRQASAVRGVQAAQRSLTSSIRAVTQAQEELNRAREDAIEQLEDMRRTTARNALDEERALLNIDEARANLAKVNADPESTELDRRNAVLDLRDAELDLLDVQDRRADDAKALAEAEKKGVENSDAVVDSRNRLADAEQNVLDAQQALADAQQELTDAQLEGPRAIRDAMREMADAQRDNQQVQIDSAQLVADAQRDLADAYQSVADAAMDAALDGLGMTDAFGDAMGKLPASARAFVNMLIGLRPLLDGLKKTAADNLFPGLTTGLQNAVTMLPLADRLIGMFGRTVGDAAANLSTLALDPGFRDDLEATGVSGANALGSILAAVRPLLRMLTRLGAAAAPLTEWFGKYILRLAEASDAQMELWRSSGGLAKFFDETRFSVENLFGGLGNLARGLINIGRIAYEVMGKQWTANLKSAGDRFREWTESVDGQNRIREYFENALPAIEEMGRLLKDLVGVFLRTSEDPNLAELIRKIRVEFLPVLESLLATGSSEFGAGIIDFFTALTDFLTAIGGSGVFGTFIKLLTEFLTVLAWASDNVPGAKQLLTVLVLMAAMSRAVSFVAYISGLKSIIGLANKKNADGVSLFSRAIKGTGTAAKAAGRQISAAFTAIGKGLAAMGRLVLANPVVLIIVAIIAALALLAYVVYRNWDTIKGWWEDGLTALGVLWAIYGQPVVDVILKAWNWLYDETRRIWDLIWQFFKEWWPLLLGAMFGPVGLIVAFIITKWDEIAAVTRAAWEAVKLWITTKLNEIVMWLVTKLVQIRAIWDAAWEWVRSRTVALWEAIKQAVIGGIDSIRDWVNSRLDSIRSKWDSVWGALSNGMSSVWDKITGAARSGANTLISILNGMIRGTNVVLGRLPGGFQIPEISAKFAKGGAVGEPSGRVGGTGASDHIPALLMPNEFVHTRASVAREGVAAHHALNQGRATIVPIDRKRREQRYRKGGQVGGVQRFAKGGLVQRGKSIIDETIGDIASPVIRGMWNTTKAVANRAISGIPDQGKVVGAVGAGAGYKIVAGADAKVQQLLARLQVQEEADRRAMAEAKKARQAKQQRDVATKTQPVVSQPINSGAGEGFVRAMAERFPTAKLNRIGATTISILGGPTGDIARFVNANQQALRVSKLTTSGAHSMRAEVYHKGGGVGYNPSKEVLALLQRGEGIATVETMAKLETVMKGVSSGSTPVVEDGRNVTVINIEINNPVGETTDESIHRSMQRVAAHGLLGKQAS